jgi:hypothetical protein
MAQVPVTTRARSVPILCRSARRGHAIDAAGADKWHMGSSGPGARAGLARPLAPGGTWRGARVEWHRRSGRPRRRPAPPGAGWTSSAGPQGREEPPRPRIQRVTTAARRMAITDGRADAIDAAGAAECHMGELGRRRPRPSRRGSVTRARRPPARTDGPARSRGPGPATVGANWHMRSGGPDDGQRPQELAGRRRPARRAGRSRAGSRIRN